MKYLIVILWAAIILVSCDGPKQKMQEAYTPQVRETGLDLGHCYTIYGMTYIRISNSRNVYNLTKDSLEVAYLRSQLKDVE